MAVLQSTDDLEEYIGNKYSLVIVAAKRARQLKEGHQALVREPSPNPLSVALAEVKEHKLQSIAPPQEEIAPAPRDMITSLVTGAEFDLDEELLDEDSDAVDDLAALLVGADDEEESEEEEEEDDVIRSGSRDEDSDVDVELEESDDSDEEDSEDEEADAEEESDEEE